MGVILALFARWMNTCVILSCKFATITELNPVTGQPMETTRRGYGLIAREVAYGDEENYLGCILYPDDEADELYDFWLKWARNLALVGDLLGLVTYICLIGSCCFFCKPWNFERWLLWCCLWASICMACTSLLYGNWFCQANVCQVSNGTGNAIFAFLAYLMLAILVKSMAQPPKRPDMPPPGGREEDDYWYDHEDERFVPGSQQTPSQPSGNGNDNGAGWTPATGNPGQSAPAQAQFFDDESIATADTEHFQHMSSSSSIADNNNNQHTNKTTSMAPHDRIDEAEEEEEDTTRRDEDEEDDIVSRDPQDLGDARFALAPYPIPNQTERLAALVVGFFVFCSTSKILQVYLVEPDPYIYQV